MQYNLEAAEIISWCFSCRTSYWPSHLHSLERKWCKYEVCWKAQAKLENPHLRNDLGSFRSDPFMGIRLIVSGCWHLIYFLRYSQNIQKFRSWRASCHVVDWMYCETLYFICVEGLSLVQKRLNREFWVIPTVVFFLLYRCFRSWCAYCWCVFLCATDDASGSRGGESNNFNLSCPTRTSSLLNPFLEHLNSLLLEIPILSSLVFGIVS